MNDLISRKTVIDLINKRIAERKPDGNSIWLRNDEAIDIWAAIEELPTAYDVADNELRILRNHIEQMPKVYRKRNANWVIVQNLLMAGTSHAGRTSSVEKCWELNIDAYGYELIAKGGEQDD